MIEPLHLKSGRKIGPGFAAYIIAEIGSNHDGSLEKAKKLITLAKKSGADAAKFQSFQASTLTNFYTKDRNNWIKEPAFDLLEKLTVPHDWHLELFNHAKNEGIDFLSTPFDLERLQLLHELDIPLIKIASGDLTNKELLLAAAKTGKPVVISTGAAYPQEIEQALSILKGAESVAILQCVSCYPTDPAQANILAMKTIQETFQVPVGYSDHTLGMAVPLGAIALGASIIEKHFTDDETLVGPDHAHSLNLKQFTEMVKSIRELESALGLSNKSPDPLEEPERIMARRAIYAKKDLSKGTILTREMIKIVRHAFPEGIPAMDFDVIIGKAIKKDLKEHELLTWDMV